MTEHTARQTRRMTALSMCGAGGATAAAAAVDALPSPAATTPTRSASRFNFASSSAASKPPLPPAPASDAATHGRPATGSGGFTGVNPLVSGALGAVTSTEVAAAAVTELRQQHRARGGGGGDAAMPPVVVVGTHLDLVEATDGRARAVRRRDAARAAADLFDGAPCYEVRR